MSKTVKTVTDFEYDEDGRVVKETTTVTETDTNAPFWDYGRKPYTPWYPAHPGSGFQIWNGSPSNTLTLKNVN